MGSTGEVWADAGLKIDSGSFSAYAAELTAAEGKISDFSSASSALMAGVYAAPAVAIGAVAASGIEMASGLQDAGVSLTNLYGNADIAKEKFQWMTTFAAKTPFNFDEVAEGAIKLKSYGMDIEQYGRTMGDAAANMGKSFTDIIEAYADAGSGEFERLKEFGVKAVQVQKSNLDSYAQYGASVGDTVLTYTDKNMQQCAQVVDRNNSQMVYSTLNNIFDAEKGFQGAMETRSKTFSGMASTIHDNFEFALSKIVGFGSATNNLEVRSASLFGVLMSVSGAVGDLTGGFADLSTPVENFIAVAGVGVVSVSLLAAGLVGYNAIVALGIGSTALFGTTLAAAFLPVTAVVLVLAGVAYGLTVLDEKTGLVSEAWQLMSDIFTIAYNHISTDFVIFKNDVIGDVQEIQQWISNIIPDWVVSGISSTIDTLRGKFDDWADKTHTDAQSMQSATEDTSTSFHGLAGAVDFFTGSATKSKTATDAATASYKGASAGLGSIDSQARASAKGLDSYIQSALDAVNATKQLWSAKEQIASQAITIREAEKTVGEGYASSGGLGSTSSEGITVVAASSSSSSGAGLGSMSGTNALTGKTTVINVGTINNNGSSISAKQTNMAVNGVA